MIARTEDPRPPPRSKSGGQTLRSPDDMAKLPGTTQKSRGAERPDSVSERISASLAVALSCTELHSSREIDRSSQGEWKSTSSYESRASYRASIARSPTLLTYNSMCHVSALGNKSFQKECNHSIDTTAISRHTALRDFFVNCEHPIELKRVHPSSPARGIAAARTGGGLRRGADFAARQCTTRL